MAVAYNGADQPSDPSLDGEQAANARLHRRSPGVAGGVRGVRRMAGPHQAELPGHAQSHSRAWQSPMPPSQRPVASETHRPHTQGSLLVSGFNHKHIQQCKTTSLWAFRPQFWPVRNTRAMVLNPFPATVPALRFGRMSVMTTNAATAATASPSLARSAFLNSAMLLPAAAYITDCGSLPGTGPAHPSGTCAARTARCTTLRNTLYHARGPRPQRAAQG